MSNNPAIGDPLSPQIRSAQRGYLLWKAGRQIPGTIPLPRVEAEDLNGLFGFLRAEELPPAAIVLLSKTSIAAFAGLLKARAMLGDDIKALSLELPNLDPTHLVIFEPVDEVIPGLASDYLGNAPWNELRALVGTRAYLTTDPLIKRLVSLSVQTGQGRRKVLTGASSDTDPALTHAMRDLREAAAADQEPVPEELDPAQPITLPGSASSHARQEVEHEQAMDKFVEEEGGDDE